MAGEFIYGLIAVIHSQRIAPEPCMRLSPHTAPGRCLLSSLAGKISGYTYHSVDWFVLMTVAVEQFQVGLLPIFMVSIYVV